MDNGLNDLVPQALEVSAGGKVFAITPVTVGQLPAMIRAMEPILPELSQGDVLAAIGRHIEAVIEMVVIGARLDRSWLDAQPADVLVLLASAVFRANLDFFVHRLTPAVQAIARDLGQAADGLTPPPGSSPTVTATEM